MFKLDTTGKETVLHSFVDTDPARPRGGLIRDAAGNLYGTTQYGGGLSNCGGDGCGTVFKLDAAGKLTDLYAFTGAFDGTDPLAIWPGTRRATFIASRTRGAVSTA